MLFETHRTKSVIRYIQKGEESLQQGNARSQQMWGTLTTHKKVKICIPGKSPQLLEDWRSENTGVKRIEAKVS